MCGCSGEDYDHGARPQAQYQYNQPQYNQPQSNHHHHQPQRPPNRRYEDDEKRKRELEARQAAARYGWPRERSHDNNRNNNNNSSGRRKDLDIQTPGNRDSYLVPQLNQSFVSMPDSEYLSYMPASYNPGRPPVYRPTPPSRQPKPYEQQPPPPNYHHHHQHHRQQQQQNSAPPVIRQQPPRAKPMSMGMTVRTNLRERPAVPGRQGSIAVSECGSDVEVSDGYVVSPMSETSPFRSPGAYGSSMRAGRPQYGRDGGAF